MVDNDVSPESLVSTATRDTSETRESNFDAGTQLAETVRSTLGPNGLDKMLVSNGTVVVTNDGASILNRLDISHPVATLIVEVAEQQDVTAGDGTTTAVVLAGELLSKADSLLEKGLHPAKITEGYQIAASHVVSLLDKRTVSIDFDDDRRLRDIARTVVTGKWDESGTEFLADRAVETVRSIERDGRIGFERITRKTIPGGSFYDSQVIDGLVIDMEESSTSVVSPGIDLPRRLEDATVALVDEELSVETAQGIGAVSVTSYDEFEALQGYEREIYDQYAEAITAVGADVVFCQQSIDEPVRYSLAESGVLSVERTRRDELHKLARATGARAAPIDDLDRARVGTASIVERQSLGSTEITIVSGFEAFDQVSVLFRGGTEHVAAETKRMLDNCFFALKLALEDEAVIPGGGATEVSLARELRSEATARSGTEQLAIEAFADVLETVPKTLAESSGLDPIDTLLELRTAHHDGRHTAGLDLDRGTVVDMIDHGVLEPLHVKRQAISSAAEAANLVTRIDGTIALDGELGGHDHGHDHDHGPGNVVHSTEGYPWAVGHSMGHDHG
ncbi:thermosome subunit 1 [Natrarchaeobius halalkaliphilus]|uniref:Thermosome subunit 1 n=1 Tax=Natrarchaeobius halalkaliphilus TaxID=1679091 RepID=A0A3N6LHU1_9EURY|nr:thermosome subunit alpha [Natrarchaeobius halalkaliphilus]RQG86784.1 thermosome subunit 1 [Natrarchaeobius halalkaliphilus]